MDRIRRSVTRLTVTTYPTLDGQDARARRITREPLITQVRDAVTTKLQPTGTMSGSGRQRVPLNVAAFDLMQMVDQTIGGMYESATDRPPRGTAEQLLIEWFETFVRAHDAGELNKAILENYAAQLNTLRWKLEEHFDRPKLSELPVCPACTYTHCLTDHDGLIVQARCVQVRLFEGGSVVAKCRSCGAQWEGGITSEGAWGEIGELQRGVADLVNAMQANVDENGKVRPMFYLAPTVNDDDANADDDDEVDVDPEEKPAERDALAVGASEMEGAQA